MMARPVARSVTQAVARPVTGRVFVTPVPPTERVQNGDFSSDTGWNTSGAAWTIAVGLATNNTAMQLLTGTLSTPLVGGETATIVAQKTANPAGTAIVIQLFNSGTSATQLVYNNVPPGGAGAGTITVPGIAVSGAFDRIRFQAIDDAGIVFDSVSLLA